MKLLAVFGLIATIGLVSGSVLPAATLIRTPQYDSAIIKSDRVGGNFAYSSLEGHAYHALTPVIRSDLVHSYQYPYHLSPFQFTYPTTSHQLIFGQPIFGQLAPVRPIAAPTQPINSPVQAPIVNPPVSQGTTPVDDDTVAIEAA